MGANLADESGIDPAVPPSGTGCVECLEHDEGWWVHLRRCAQCGHVGCCDTSPAQHASQHAEETGHPVARSFEPGEAWFWDYRTQGFTRGPELEPPQSRPEEQGSPAPADRVPQNWLDLIHR